MFQRTGFSPIPKPGRRLRNPAAIEAARADWCELCNRATDQVPCHVHHVRSRGAGGHDRDDNLMSLCHDCHHKVHTGEISRDELRRQFERALAERREAEDFLRRLAGAKG